MNTNMLALASGLSDHDLLTRLLALAGKEREATVELVAHLAALDSRPSVYAAKGFGSLFSYCVEALRLSEDATCNRIYAARACRRFPAILEALSAGEMLSTVHPVCSAAALIDATSRADAAAATTGAGPRRTRRVAADAPTICVPRAFTK